MKGRKRREHASGLFPCPRPCRSPLLGLISFILVEHIRCREYKYTTPSGHTRAVDKPPYIGNISDYHGKLCIKLPISVAKKKVMVCYAMAFIIRFRFNAVDDKRHCCSAASNPLLYRNFKLCLAFCVAKLPSLHICRRSKTFACLSVPSFS